VWAIVVAGGTGRRFGGLKQFLPLAGLPVAHWSVRDARAVADDAAVIVVHDAARPLAGAALFGAVVDAVRAGGVDGVVPVVPVADTLKRVAGDRVVATVDRADLVAVQTPQAFVAGALRSAHRSGDDASDDAGLLEAEGLVVGTVPGDPRNLKLTRPEDLAMAEALLHGADR